MEESQQKFEQWAIVDVMGHQRYVGRVTEQVIAGQGFVRVDIPKTSEVEAWTKLIGTASIYAITPVDKDIALQMAERAKEKPIEAYQLTAKMIGAASQHEIPFHEDDDELPI